MDKQHTILVVDDEIQIVRSLINMLRLDYRVLGATNAEEAMQILDREPVHVVMSDQRMPEMTGVDLLERIAERHPNVVRLLFTGYADINAVIEAINRGRVYRYVAKPWNPEDLQLIIRDACAYHDLMTERRAMIAELQRKNAELEASNELKTAFIHVAGHEFRTPVAILTAFCKLALLDPTLSASARENFARIDAAAGRLDRLVSQVLGMLAAGRFDRMVARQPRDLAHIVNQAVADVRPFVELRRQTLNTDIAADLGSAAVDAEKIRDSVYQLLTNAIRFTPDHGVITVAARRGAEGITIRISDTGDGVAPECLPRIFEPFFTGFDVSRHSSGHFEYATKGVGLGLSLVKAFIEMHGGTVTMESELNKGSTFTIHLPLAAAMPAQPIAMGGAA